MNAIELLRSESLTTLLEREIERLVLIGELRPGERVNEKRLADRFQISRGPIREACRGLERTGLLASVPNRGSFVREVDEKEALDIYDVRKVLFGLAGALAADRATARDIVDLAGLHKAMAEAVLRRDFSAYYPVNLHFHSKIIEMARNPTLARSYHEQIKKLHLFRARGLIQTGSLAESNDEHGRILAAIKQADRLRARAVCEEHVCNAKSRLVASLSGISRSDHAR
jgi:DNA-binding GntR family transcriptional regulator